VYFSVFYSLFMIETIRTTVTLEAVSGKFACSSPCDMGGGDEGAGSTSSGFGIVLLKSY